VSLRPSPVILNAGDPSNISSERSIDIALTLAMADLKAQFIEAEKGIVHYRSIRRLRPLNSINISREVYNPLIFTP